MRTTFTELHIKAICLNNNQQKIKGEEKMMKSCDINKQKP